MANYQRSTWTLLLFLGLLVPFVAVLAITFSNSMQMAAKRAAATQAANSQAATAPATQTAAATEQAKARIPLLAAGDEKTLWLVHPVILDPTGKKIPACELLARTSDAGAWSAIRDRSNAYFFDYPRDLAVVSPPSGTKSHATAYVFWPERGGVQLFSPSGESSLVDDLPPDQSLLAVAGSAEGAFALTVGPPSVSTTRPGDVVKVYPREPATSEPYESQSQAGTAPASSEPAGAQTEPSLINVYWFHDRHWTMLPPLGPANPANAEPATAAGKATGEAGDLPAAGALVTLASCSNRLIALWINPAHGDVLQVGSLEYQHRDASWKTAASVLPLSVPADSRLMSAVLDKTLYVFWPTVQDDAVQIRGGWLITNSGPADLQLPARNMLPPLMLKGAGGSVAPGTDVALGPAENSLAVIVNSPDAGLTWYVFDTRGLLLSGPAPVKVQEASRDVQFAQTIAWLLLVLMVMLSFFQWRQRPGPIKLEPGLAIARPTMRAAAFLIDIAVSLVVISTIFGLWENNEWYTRLVSMWGQTILNFDSLFNSPLLMSFWGFYLLHVTIGELFFHRSIGKAFTGLRVMMIDGKPPTLAAILVRNLIRLPELLLGILIIYFFISPNRQRLGDLVARTIVVSAKPPEVPKEEGK